MKPSKGLIATKGICAAMLVVALGQHPYGFHTLLRWIVCGVSVFSAIRAQEAKRAGWTWLFGVVALLFNPLIPVHLERGIWAPVDVVAAVAFLISIWAVDHEIAKSQKIDSIGESQDGGGAKQ